MRRSLRPGLPGPRARPRPGRVLSHGSTVLVSLVAGGVTVTVRVTQAGRTRGLRLRVRVPARAAAEATETLTVLVQVLTVLARRKPDSDPRTRSELGTSSKQARPGFRVYGFSG